MPRNVTEILKSNEKDYNECIFFFFMFQTLNIIFHFL